MAHGGYGPDMPGHHSSYGDGSGSSGSGGGK
jgi:hypothetical protein